MPDEAMIDDALKKENLDLPNRPVIETIEADYIEDSSGEDSLEVWVVLSGSTQDNELTGESVADLTNGHVRTQTGKMGRRHLWKVSI